MLAACCRRPGLRICVGIAGCAYVEPQHHGMVFMYDVMAVHYIPAKPVAEAHLNGRVALGRQSDGILAGQIHT
jgi:hypothetical protein